MSEVILEASARREERRLGLFDRQARKAVFAMLRGIRSGELVWVDPAGTERFGEPGAELRAVVRVRDTRAYRALLLRGAVGGAEAYMDGHWSCDDLTALIRIVALQREALSGLNGTLSRLSRPALRLVHALRRNSKAGSRRNIAAHYDLGNDFFSLFLDPTMTYSSGIFERPEASMEQASIAKYDRACRKLRLGPGDHVLEIGTGWGGFALHAATEYGCRVTTTTVSAEQHAYASERVEAAGLGDRVEVLLCDYRDLTGQYDKLVSIEMIEAVGADHLGTFFRVCSERLKPEGVMFLQAISVRDQDYASSLKSVDFIKRYIFPGGQLVSLGAISGALARASDMRITHVEDITEHYAETLARWRGRMQRNLDAMRGLGLPDRFLRMWHYYLCYCEGAFLERATLTHQLVLEKDRCRRTGLLGRLGQGPAM